ncbi:uncharacterized protein LOC108627320 [Ceratina calcarata]|uniref:Uncharacterized protein LOC108627320 n=1 Tax=Ceratina calcarata TaxID=156304 RepID=A0AAJ7J3J9_9HYME|nr:uncharacterized protein LOC108627320 [Ceratina calcarata]
MLRRNVLAVFTFLPVIAVNGMPQNADNSGQASSANLPLIQFTNGGIRLNFAGYHAAAGLGGLLGGSQTGGGLHASAGTPWGAHAGAGLGGLLGGDNANAGGGLYARAGLGNGRHEAAAGLGGMLDGSGRSANPIRGGLFATTGLRGVGLSAGDVSGIPIPVPSAPDAPFAPSNQKPDEHIDKNKPNPENPNNKGRTNIQIISRSDKKHKNKLVGESSTESPKPADPPANKEIREVIQAAPAAGAGLFGVVSVEPQVPPVTRTIQKVKVISSGIEPVPPAPSLPSEANEVTDNFPRRVRIGRPIRKRLWGPRKQIIFDYGPAVEAQPTVHSAQKRQATNDASNTPSPNNPASQTSNTSGFFDDIFNIPISTLNAVNQLLTNNSG